MDGVIRPDPSTVDNVAREVLDKSDAMNVSVRNSVTTMFSKLQNFAGKQPALFSEIVRADWMVIVD